MEAMHGSFNAIQIKAASLGIIARQYSGNTIDDLVTREHILLLLLIAEFRWLKKGLSRYVGSDT